MDNKFYKRFTKIIRQCNYENTYKMAWAKALVELATDSTYEDDIVEIKLQDIAKKYIKLIKAKDFSGFEFLKFDYEVQWCDFDFLLYLNSFSLTFLYFF